MSFSDDKAPPSPRGVPSTPKERENQDVSADDGDQHQCPPSQAGHNNRPRPPATEELARCTKNRAPPQDPDPRPTDRGWHDRGVLRFGRSVLWCCYFPLARRPLDSSPLMANLSKGAGCESDWRLRGLRRGILLAPGGGPAHHLAGSRREYQRCLAFSVTRNRLVGWRSGSARASGSRRAFG